MNRGGLIALAVFLFLLLGASIITIIYVVGSVRPRLPDDYLEIQTFPSGYYFDKEAGSRLEISCSYKKLLNSSRSQLKWKIPRDRLNEQFEHVSIREYYENKSSILIFRNGAPEVNGNYVCSSGYQQISIQVNFRVRKPFFNHTEEVVAVNKGTEIILTCEPRSNRRLTFEWFDQDSSPITNSPQRYVESSDDRSSLIIPIAEEKHNGVYLCKATNIYGSSNKKFQLFVNIDDGPPRFEKKLTTVKVRIDGSLEIECIANGEKPIIYKWYNPDQEVILADKSLPIHYEPKQSSSLLIFRKVEAKDTGDYICTAKNDLGLVSTIFQVVADADSGVAPKFDNYLQNVTVARGSKVELLCCDPRVKNVTYEWINQHGEVVPEESTQAVYASPTGRGSVLTINSVDSNHTGSYSCYGWNRYGYAMTEFDIIIDPVSESAPNFKKEYEDVIAEEGTKLEVLCFATGDMPINYTWYNQDSEILEYDSGSSVAIEDNINGSMLVITKLEKNHEGLYICGAKNDQGLHSKVFNIVVIPPSENKTTNETIDDIFVKMLKVTADSVLFAVATQEAVDTIQVRYIDTWTSKQEDKTFKKRDSYELNNLTAGAVYNFTFRVIENSGNRPTSGNWSEVYRVPLYPRKPEVIFRNINVDTVKIELFTTMQERMSGTIDKYELEYRTVQIQSGDFWVPSQCAATIVKPACHGSSFTIADMQREVYYELAVRGHTEAGYGEPYTQKFYLK